MTFESLRVLSSLALAAPPPLRAPGLLPHDASLDGHLVDWLLHSTTFFVSILFVIMCAWMVYAAVKHNESHVAEYDHGTSKHSVTTALVLSALIFFVVDGNLFYFAMRDVNGTFWNWDRALKNPDAVRIQINAHQWAWDARYAGPDGKFNTEDDVVTLNDIRVPIGAPIVMQLASTDVIHSFYLPNFRVKMDAVPGQVNNLYFQAKETGEFEIGCAQHCGPSHYKMRGQLTVMEKDAYEAWVKTGSADGKRVYDPADKDANWGWEWRKT